ncbi:Uncharacterised protein [Chlamydia trachomatis]|nr:Uncharacterised protein [Chlamydia trachomatis]
MHQKYYHPRQVHQKVLNNKQYRHSMHQHRVHLQEKTNFLSRHIKFHSVPILVTSLLTVKLDKGIKVKTSPSAVSISMS